MRQLSCKLLSGQSVFIPARSRLIHYAARLSGFLFVNLFLFAVATACSAQTYYNYPESSPVSGGGTLNYTLQVQMGYCGGLQTDADVFENFSYTPSGGTNTMSLTLNTSTAGCVENVSLYEDTLFHTYAFQIPTGIAGCP
jgi:hypothetical protein